MKFGDRLLQNWRIRKASKWIKPGARVLDIGCDDGSLFTKLADQVGSGVGVDPGLKHELKVGNSALFPGRFPSALPDAEPFDAITMLAVLEHIPEERLETFASDCVRYLRPKGRLIITVPSPWVDGILVVLKRVKIVDTMALDEHYGFVPGSTPSIFEPVGLRLLKHQRFQLGLNNLYVFERP